MIIDKKLPEYTVSNDSAISLHDNVSEALRLAVIKLKEEQETSDKKKKGGVVKKGQVQKKTSKKAQIQQ